MNTAIVEAVASAVRPHDPDGVVVALGGGADSACLLAATVDALDLPVRGVFVDHGLEHSARLEGAAVALGVDLGVPVHVLSAHVVDGPDLESRARLARYRAIEHELAGTEVALTAHTRDDQAETVLMRLAAGSGSTGLAGIPARRDRWIRPLLGFSRSEVRAEATDRGLPFVDDPANDDDRFLRNRVRHHVLPLVASELGDHVQRGLARSAQLLADDDTALGALAERIRIRPEADGVLVPTAPLITEDAPIAARACRRAIRLAVDGHPGTSGDVAAILDTAATGRTHSLSGGLLVVNEGPEVRIGQPPRPEDPAHLPLGGSIRWSGVRLRMVADDRTPVVEGGRYTPLDLDAVADGVVVRGVEPGDRLDIGTGSTPVTELLRVHGVATPLRPVSPVAVVDGKIAAVLGVRTAAWAHVRRRGARAIIEREVGT